MEIRFRLETERETLQRGDLWEAKVIMEAGHDMASIGGGFIPSGSYELISERGRDKEEAETRAFYEFRNKLLRAFEPEIYDGL